MKKTLINGIILGIIFIVVSGFIYNSSIPAKMLKTLNVKIEKSSDNTWRVKDNNGNDKGVMKVNKKDKISWHANGSEMVFIFSKDIKEYFDFEEGLFEDGRTQKVDNNKKLQVTLKPDAPAGELVYEVYVVDAVTSVIGNSPPRIIIR